MFKIILHPTRLVLKARAPTRSPRKQTPLQNATRCVALGRPRCQSEKAAVHVPYASTEVFFTPGFFSRVPHALISVSERIAILGHLKVL